MLKNKILSMRRIEPVRDEPLRGQAQDAPTASGRTNKSFTN
jgi:hypothetical protein